MKKDREMILFHCGKNDWVLRWLGNTKIYGEYTRRKDALKEARKLTNHITIMPIKTTKEDESWAYKELNSLGL